jgi:hypothetical protein
MLLDEVLDVPPVPALRPTALVVLPGHLVGLVGDLRQLAAAQPPHLAALAADERDEGGIAPREPCERREVEVVADVDVVG